MIKIIGFLILVGYLYVADIYYLSKYRYNFNICYIEKIIIATIYLWNFTLPTVKLLIIYNTLCVCIYHNY